MDIKKRIKERGFSLEDVAAKLTNSRGGVGISQPSMSSIINGNTTFARLKEIAEIIGISVSELVADEEAGNITCCPHCGKPIKITLE